MRKFSAIILSVMILFTTSPVEAYATTTVAKSAPVTAPIVKTVTPVVAIAPVVATTPVVNTVIPVAVTTSATIAVTPVVTPVAPATPAFQSTNISTWLWDATEIASKPDTIIQELVANKVKTLFLQVDSSVKNSQYQSFIGKASANNISVYALDGSPDWVSASGSTFQQRYIHWLTTYQKSASATQKFKGMHLDVEPFGNAQYNANTNSILENYQTFITSFSTQATKLNLDFGIDIPFWFYGTNYVTKYGKGNIAEWLCKNVKSMTIMAYRNTASSPDGGIIGISAKEMTLFAQYNVKGTIAVETGPLSAADSFTTFCGKGQPYMDQQLDLVYQNYKSSSAFNGIAIHYLDSWMAMGK